MNHHISGNPDSDPKIQQYVENSKLNRIRDKYKEDIYYYGYIDIGCHNYLTKYVEIDLESVP